MLHLRYFFGSIVSLLLLPLLQYQGKKIRKKVPKLSEAKEPKGYIKKNSETTLKIIALGESTIAGVGVDFHKNGFIGSLANEIATQKNVSVLWRVYAKSGYTAKLVRLKLISKIEESNADIIIIGLGGNDAFTLNSPYLWIFQINIMIKDLKKKYPNTPIYFTNMPPIKDFPAFTKTIKFVIGNLVEILGKKLQTTIKNKRNVYYNYQTITLKDWKKRFKIDGDATVFFSDGIHPSKLSYQVWGKDMAHFILNSNSFKNK